MDLRSSSENQNEVNESKNEFVEMENRENVVKEEGNVLKFLDSMDDYLILIESLSSILRRGWLDLASARHSMGVSRINTSLLDLKLHSAATTLKLDHENEMQDKRTESTGSPLSVDDPAQKERLKLLSMFGALISPKLRLLNSHLRQPWKHLQK